jgi:hypothetical protein
MESVLMMLAGLHPAVPLVLAMLGGLVVLGQAYVAMTPSESDDAWYAQLEAKPILGGILKAIKAFAPIQRK